MGSMSWPKHQPTHRSQAYLYDLLVLGAHAAAKRHQGGSERVGIAIETPTPAKPPIEVSRQHAMGKSGPLGFRRSERFEGSKRGQATDSSKSRGKPGLGMPKGRHDD